MAPLPPVRKRTDYADVTANDLVFALFHDRVRGNLAALSDLPQAMPAGPSFQVFKDARGAYRWVAISSTAYQDRDREIVSTKALEDDVDRADASGEYGPLLWWHEPGLILGDTDFNAIDGRVLIESGTFRSEAIAQKVAKAAEGLGISIGFVHPPSDPDQDGVFHTIRRFERSLTPREKASNLFTSFQVKEQTMALNSIKRAGLKAIGFSDEEIAGIEGWSAETQKSAEDAGVAFKSAEPEEPVYYNAAGEPGTIVDGAWTAKAAAPPVAEVAEVAEDEVELMAEDDGMELDDSAMTLSAGDIAAIGEAVAAAFTQAMGPLIGALDIESKMSSYVGEMKSMLGGYTAQKSAADAEQRQQVQELAATVKAQGEQLAELNGLQPAATRRATDSLGTVVRPDDPLVLAAKKSAEPFADLEFGDIISGLGLANLNGNG